MINVVHAEPDAPTDRRPLLFVHGAWHGAWCWEEYLIPWFVARGYPCHAVDLRGHGGSPIDGSLRFARIQHYVDDVHTIVDQLTREPVVVAHSMGGLVVQRLLERIDLPGAVLLAPTPVGGVWRATLRVMRRHPMAFASANLRWRLWPLVSSVARAHDLLLAPDAPPDEVRRHASRLQDESYLAYLDMLFVTRPRPPLVHTDVAVIAGDRDRIFSVSELRRTAAAYGAPFHVVEGAAHDLMLDPTWERVAMLVDEFASTR